MKFLWTIFIFFSMLSACKNESGNSSDNSTQLPPMPKKEIQMLKDKVTTIDITYEETEAAFDIFDEIDLEAELSIIGYEGSEINPDCELTSMSFYKIDGEVIYYSQVYYGPGCNYIVFSKDNKPLYVNKISEQGMRNIALLLEQLKQMRQKFDKMREEGYE